MKTIPRLVAMSALATACHAAPFLAVGDNAELFITGTVGVRADSNIFLMGDDPSLPAAGREVEDVIYDFNPGVQLVFGKNSATQGTLGFTESFTRYTDHSDLDDNLSSAFLNTRYEDGKSKLSLNASYTEVNQNTVDVRPSATAPDALILREILSAGATGEISVTEKTSIAAGVQYSETEFEQAGFSDSQVFTLPVNYYYELTPKVDLSLGYRYRERAESINFDSKDHFFSVGARGEFTPKLSGQFAVGYSQRSFSHKVLRRGDQSLFGIDSSLTFAVSPKTNLQLGVSNDFDTNAQGNQQKNLAVRAAATTAISADLSVSATVSYRRIDYYQATPQRVDDYFEGQLGATYTFSQTVSVTGAYSYRSNKSDLVFSKFDGSVVSLAANLRF